ncbi:MAG: dephospho-CoA kinase [Acidobacteriota bacterium]
MSALRVGLTGGLASGKSTVADMFREHGLTVVDADRLVAELYQPGGAGAAAVRELFGDEAMTPEGAVHHPAVAQRVFADQEARHRLEAAIHPLVRRRFAEIVGETEGIVVLEATLLVEAGYGPDFDWVLSVEAPEEVRLARAVERGLDEAGARARLQAQGDGAQRRAGVDQQLINDGSLDDLRAKVADVVDELRVKAASPT